MGSKRPSGSILGRFWEGLGGIWKDLGEFGEDSRLFLIAFWKVWAKRLLNFLGASNMVWGCLGKIFQGFGEGVVPQNRNLIDSIWAPHAHSLSPELVQQPPRYLATPRGASQFAFFNIDSYNCYPA